MTPKCDPHKPTNCSIKWKHFNFCFKSLKHFISLTCCSTLFLFLFMTIRYQTFTPIFLNILSQVSSLKLLSLTVFSLLMIPRNLLSNCTSSCSLWTYYTSTSNYLFFPLHILLQLSTLNFSLCYFYEFQIYISFSALYILVSLQNSSDIYIPYDSKQTKKCKTSVLQYFSSRKKYISDKFRFLK